MTARDVLIAAKALIDTEDKWFGKNQPSRGRPGARCAWYAITAAAGVEYPLRRAAVDDFVRVLPPSIRRSQRSKVGAVIRFNDTRTHRSVMSAFDRAIEAAS